MILAGMLSLLVHSTVSLYIPVVHDSPVNLEAGR